MDMETQRFSFTDFLTTVPKCISSSYLNPLTDLETRLAVNSHVQDDNIQIINLLKTLFISNSLDHADDQTTVVSKFLRFCCSFDSIKCSTSLFNGELGPLAMINEVDKSSGMLAELHAARCVEMLLKKLARTDIKNKDGRRLVALQLSLFSSSMDVTWNPDEYSLEDLIVMLGEKDLTTVKLLREKTKEVYEVEYANAVGGRIVALAALLVVVADRVNESSLVLHDSDLGAKEKTTIYEFVIREAWSLGRETTTLRAVKRKCTPSKRESAEKRKLVLLEIELLQLFDAVDHGSRMDKKVASPLILAAQPGDEIEILLKSNVDASNADAEGNSAFHCSLRTSSMGSSQIIGLLLKQGAQVRQKNKLGLTALHIAAGSGNSQALEGFIRGDPGCVNVKTIMKETPLLFAVKNDHMVCAELLLSCAVILSHERSIDLAKSQDTRFLLKAVNICHTNLAFLSQDKYASLESDDVISETSEAPLSIMDDSTNTERIWSSAKVEICKYFESPTGCIRGSKCFYAHGEEELRKTKQGMHLIRSPKEEFKRKIFVGGLPLSLDSESDSLAEFFEEHFGSVEDARIVGIQIEEQIQSRGFGFVTFKHENSVSSTVQAHFITIMSKQVEIESALPIEILLSDLQKQSALQQEFEHNQSQLQAKSPGEKPTEELTSRKVKEEILTKMAEEIPCRKITQDAKTKEISWAGKLLHGQPKTCYNESQAQLITSFEEKNMPKWLRTFKKWLPRFLKDVYKHPIEEEYAVSSPNSDFKAAFGLELDHASLGYPKISDFMKTLPNLCHVKAGTISKNGSPNHMVLLPSLPKRKGRVLQSFTTQSLSSPSNSVSDSNDCDFNGSKSPQEFQSVFNEYADFTISTIDGKPSHDIPAQRDTSTSLNSASMNEPIIDYTRFLRVLKPCLFSGNGNDGGSGGNNNGGGGGLEESEEKKLRPLPRHAVLEALARKRNNRSAFFLREFDFYDDYKSSLNQVKCFGCSQRQMLWANIPCQHLLWCNDCKLEAVRAAGVHEHKCVICDMKVEEINLLPSNRCHQSFSEDISDPEAFPPLNASLLRSLPRRNRR